MASKLHPIPEVLMVLVLCAFKIIRAYALVAVWDFNHYVLLRALSHYNVLKVYLFFFLD